MKVKAERYDVMRFALRSIEIMGKLTDLIHRFRRLHGLPRGSSFSGGRVFWGPSLDVIARKE